jgi:hypothetical protein
MADGTELSWAARRTVAAAGPLALGGIRERFLREFSGRGRDRRKLQYAVLEAAAPISWSSPAAAARLGISFRGRALRRRAWLNLFRLAVEVGVDQLVLLDLSRAGAGELVEEDPPSGGLVGG